jgi:hypothetical protein
MRVAIITAGQPRFTNEFLRVLIQLRGFDTADLYVNLWESTWAESEEQGCRKINKVLPPRIKLKKLRIVPEPERTLPPCDPSANLEEVRWWYIRRIGQIHCLKMAFDLIDEPYDLVVRIRPDGSLVQDLDLTELDLTNNEMIFANNWAGVNQTDPNDQFFVGTYKGMKFLVGLYDEFDKYMIAANPNWSTDVWNWALERILREYYEQHGKSLSKGPFTHEINRGGKSAYTVDKHPHHRIVPDPTA